MENLQRKQNYIKKKSKVFKYKENWFALYLAISSQFTISESLRLMSINPGK